MIAPLQSIMGRAAIGWSLKDLADHAEIARSAVQRFEGGGNSNSDTIHKIKTALEDMGVVFLFDDGNGVGVRFSLTKWRPVDETKQDH